MTNKQQSGEEAFDIMARVIRQEGHCAAGHQVGDEVFFDGQTVQGKVCLSALYSFLPKVFAMRYGAKFPWLDDPDVTTHACPDARNPVWREPVIGQPAMGPERNVSRFEFTVEPLDARL